MTLLFICFNNVAKTTSQNMFSSLNFNSDVRTNDDSSNWMFNECP